MAYFDIQCLEALQKIGTELQKIREIMEVEHIEEEPTAEKFIDDVLKEREEKRRRDALNSKIKRIIEPTTYPNEGDIVFLFSENGESIFPCEIIDGNCFKNGKFTNNRTWVNLITGQVDSGYRVFYKPVWRKNNENRES